MAFWIIQTLNGLSFSMMLFLVAAGFTLIFGLMKIINIAHGSFYLLSAYIGLTVLQATESFLAGDDRLFDCRCPGRDRHAESFPSSISYDGASAGAPDFWLCVDHCGSLSLDLGRESHGPSQTLSL